MQIRRSAPHTSAVALLAEGVDRNVASDEKLVAADVALLAEGVDRNRHIPGTIPIDNRSPSSRRAWIEIVRPRGLRCLPRGRPPRGGRG